MWSSVYKYQTVHLNGCFIWFILTQLDGKCVELEVRELTERVLNSDLVATVGNRYC